MALAADLGAEINLDNLRTQLNDNENILFSESQGRIAFTVKPELKDKLEAIFDKDDISLIGKISDEKILEIKSNNQNLLSMKVEDTDYKRFSKGFYNG